ncbi:MAG TPA: hypothetical protein PKY64_00880 [Anaerolineaceae bacterium]|nr:hypothetical protein [Anaerolineaceae bacterium]
MKKNLQFALVITMLVGLVALPILSQKGYAMPQRWVDPPTETPAPTQVPWGWVPNNGNVVNPSGWVPNNAIQQVTERPMLYIADYYTSLGNKSVNPYGNFDLSFIIRNGGKANALNVLLVFSSQDFDPLDGGVASIKDVTVSDLNEGRTHQFRVNDMSTWKYSGIITAAVSYMDELGNTYSETFTFTLIINQTGSTGSTAATATPSAVMRPQMVVNSYTTDIDPLQPGSHFKLGLKVSNAGTADARAVSLVYGGGATAGTTDPLGTPQAGGVGGAGGDVSNFAPVGNSNVILLGDVPMGGTLSPEQEFIVNVTTNPGAYPLKLSFVYTDTNGVRMVDDQVITLLVYSLPQLEFSFYQPMEGMITAGQMGMLPIQITNLSRKSVVLGNVVATSPNGEMSNNSILVGTLDPGGYYTFDPMFMPFSEGEAAINFEIRYTDDFNQLRTYNSSLTINVNPPMEMPQPYPLLDENGNPVLDENGNPIMVDPMNPFPDGNPQEPVSQPGFFARIWNAIKSFFGFGSDTNNGKPTEPGMNGEIYYEGGGGKLP